TVATAPVGAAGAGALAERLGVRGGLAVVAAGALLLTLATLFGTRLQRIKT
ncbi:MAG: MFS transporter, partial [Massilia sp.]|nr:MFS transporter [Massilia sp.]